VVDVTLSSDWKALEDESLASVFNVSIVVSPEKGTFIQGRVESKSLSLLRGTARAHFANRFIAINTFFFSMKSFHFST